MKACQPTRTHLAIVVCIVVVQAMLLRARLATK